MGYIWALTAGDRVCDVFLSLIIRQPAGAVGHYLLMTEWTADLMDRWMGSLMNAWQVLCQSGRQSKTQGEGRNHLDSRDTFERLPHTSKSPPHRLSGSPPLAIKLQPYSLVLMRLLLQCFCHLMAGYVAPISAGSNLEKCP